MRLAPSVHRDPRPGCAIQEPLEVEAGKLIVSVLTDMRRERRHCAGIAGFQLGKCVQIAFRLGTPLPLRQGLR